MASSKELIANISPLIDLPPIEIGNAAPTTSALTAARKPAVQGMPTQEAPPMRMGMALQGVSPKPAASDGMPSQLGPLRKLSHEETVAIDGVECSYIDTRTGKIIPPWDAPGVSPQSAAQMRQNYRESVARNGGTWNPFPNAAK